MIHLLALALVWVELSRAAGDPLAAGREEVNARYKRCQVAASALSPDALPACRAALEAPRALRLVVAQNPNAAPREFRKDVMDAMKQGAPDRYRDQNKAYYAELVK